MSADLLARRSNDLIWLFSTPVRVPARAAAHVRRSVFRNEDVRWLLARDPLLRARIESILEEMAHTWSLSGIRVAGFFVTKVMRRVCSALLVDQEVRIAPSSPLFCDRDDGAAATICRLLAEAPVLYLPSHRSYADFIVLSYVCFAMGLPLPAIAAGTDFLSLNQVASLLRACGAFFIRRSSLKSDPVYWTTFKAYVEAQIVAGGMPIEVFVEGGRSRSGKSLPPKTGLLSIAVNLFLSGAITDLIILPICISYDRLLEETLYANEISPGASGSKPRETTDHLLAGARKILDQSHGSIYVRFCEPIPLRHWCTLRGTDIRKNADRDPSLVSRLVTEVAHSVIREQVSGTILSAFDLFSFVIVAQHANLSPGHSGDELAVSFSQVEPAVNELLQLIPDQNRSRTTRHPIAEDLRKSFQIHEKKFVQLCGDRLILKWDVVSRNMLRIYANKCLQLVINYAICSHVQSLESFAVVKQLLAAEFCPAAAGESESLFAESFHSVSSISSNLKFILSTYAIFYMRTYQQICVWLEGVCEEERFPVPESGGIAAGRMFHPPLDFTSLTRRAAGDLSLASDLLSNFWLLVQQRVVAADSKVVFRNVLQQMKREIALLLPNGDIVGGDAKSAKSML